MVVVVVEMVGIVGMVVIKDKSRKLILSNYLDWSFLHSNTAAAAATFF